MLMGRVFALGLLAASAASAQAGFELSNPMYTITFTRSWSVVFQPSFLGKSGGMDGLAYVGCEPGQAAPSNEAQAAAYSAILGGTITAGAGKDTAIGKYTVRRQEFNYDSLPRLDSMIEARSGFAIKHRNGNFRVYTIVADGYVFALAGLAALPGAPAPYADMERALATLVLHPGAGVRWSAAGGNRLWLRGNTLGGEWLAAHPPLAVECFDLRGTRVGRGRPEGEGWLLPSEGGIVRVTGRDGASAVLFR